GYVGPFLERLATHLPSPRYRRVPMYALSTETIETMTHFPAGRGGGDVAFLPTGAGTLYELLPEDESGEPDRPDRLIPPWRAIPGRNFSLVVSDAFGLRRYQTNDLFRCERMIAGLPDLRFLRRRGLEHSFTGEKVTGQQLADVFADLRATISGVRAAAFLTCVPSQPPDERVPHYRLVLVGAPGAAPLDMEALAADADRRLRAVNFEYRDKVHSGRLGPMRGIEMDLPALVALIGGDRHRADWEAQLKFLPLYPRTWEALTAAASA
ncbi:MAG: GH3 auxin-responsive promoter family protein, partial [Pseudomonadota bacterium]